MTEGSRATPIGGAPPAAAEGSGRRWRAAIFAGPSTGQAEITDSLCSSRPSISSPTLLSIQKTGGTTAMWPAAAPRGCRWQACWDGRLGFGSSAYVWTTTMRAVPPATGWSCRLPGQALWSTVTCLTTRTGTRTCRDWQRTDNKHRFGQLDNCGKDIFKSMEIDMRLRKI